MVSGLLGLIGSIVGLTLVPDISDVSRVGIGNVVGHDLGAAIGKSHAVLTSGSITITVFVLGIVGARVVIKDSIAIVVDSGTIISGLSVVSGSGMVDGSGLVGSRVVRSGSGVVGSGVVHGGVDGDVARGVSGGGVLLLVVVLVDLIGGGSGLGLNVAVVRAMRLVDGGGHGGGVAVLDALVAVLVGGSQSQKGGKGDESLKNFKIQRLFKLVSGSCFCVRIA